MNINDLKTYIANNNPYNFPVNVLENKNITNEQRRLDFEDGKYIVSCLNEKTYDNNPASFDSEEKAVDLFKKMWDAGLKSYENSLEKSNKIMNEL